MSGLTCCQPAACSHSPTRTCQSHGATSSPNRTRMKRKLSKGRFLIDRPPSCAAAPRQAEEHSHAQKSLSPSYRRPR
eukprot:scaffold107444_cov28-Tisochrysis_lutea.AAC.3